MLDFIVFFNTILETLVHLRRPFTRLFTQPFLTATLLTSLYAGYHMVHESSVAGGLWVAFFETNAGRAIRLREREDAILQAEMRNLAVANKAIDRLLESLLEHAPNVARVRLDVIHNGVNGVTGLGLLRYDTTNAVAGAGHAAGTLVQNRPLTELGDFLQGMLSGACRVYLADELHSVPVKGRMEILNVGTILVCPVADIQGRLLGAVFMLWDAGTKIPEGPHQDVLMSQGKQVGREIATVLDLRTPENWLAR